MIIDSPAPKAAPRSNPTARALHGQSGVLRCKMRRPPSVEASRWRQVMLHACSQGRVRGLQSFSIDDDVASLSVLSTGAQGNWTALIVALSGLDAELRRPALP